MVDGAKAYRRAVFNNSFKKEKRLIYRINCFFLQKMQLFFLKYPSYRHLISRIIKYYNI